MKHIKLFEHYNTKTFMEGSIIVLLNYDKASDQVKKAINDMPNAKKMFLEFAELSDVSADNRIFSQGDKIILLMDYEKAPIQIKEAVNNINNVIFFDAEIAEPQDILGITR